MLTSIKLDQLRITSFEQALPWTIIVLGVGAMFGPSFYDLFNGIWRSEQQAHGPIVLVVSIWLFFFKLRQSRKDGVFYVESTVSGWTSLIVGVILYIVGRSQSFLVFEIGSLVPIILGIVLLTLGSKVAARLWFAFFFLAFIVPLPASLVDMLTQPLKLAVSVASEQVLFWAGFPVARSGVMITVGQYQLLVADACAGLNSLFTLEALGLLYLNVTHHPSAARNLLLALLIIPISFISNVTRVIVLALITYYFGDAAGQGFLHEFSGMVLFMTALLFIILTDALVRTSVARYSAFKSRAKEKIYIAKEAT